MEIKEVGDGESGVKWRPKDAKSNPHAASFIYHPLELGKKGVRYKWTFLSYVVSSRESIITDLLPLFFCLFRLSTFIL